MRFSYGYLPSSCHSVFPRFSRWKCTTWRRSTPPSRPSTFLQLGEMMWHPEIQRFLRNKANLSGNTLRQDGLDAGFAGFCHVTPLFFEGTWMAWTFFSSHSISLWKEGVMGLVEHPQLNVEIFLCPFCCLPFGNLLHSYSTWSIETVDLPTKDLKMVMFHFFWYPPVNQTRLAGKWTVEISAFPS